MITFAEKIKALRIERGLTQREVARGADIAERQYQSYEGGERKPSIDSILYLACFFDVSIDYLVGRTDKPEVNK